jgi:hypothetical protein
VGSWTAREESSTAAAGWYDFIGGDMDRAREVVDAAREVDECNTGVANFSGEVA